MIDIVIFLLQDYKNTFQSISSAQVECCFFILNYSIQCCFVWFLFFENVFMSRRSGGWTLVIERNLNYLSSLSFCFSKNKTKRVYLFVKPINNSYLKPSSGWSETNKQFVKLKLFSCLLFFLWFSPPQS